MLVVKPADGGSHWHLSHKSVHMPSGVSLITARWGNGGISSRRRDAATSRRSLVSS